MAATDLKEAAKLRLFVPPEDSEDILRLPASPLPPPVPKHYSPFQRRLHEIVCSDELPAEKVERLRQIMLNATARAIAKVAEAFVDSGDFED